MIQTRQPFNEIECKLMRVGEDGGKSSRIPSL
jgi:hypothetical protein